MNLSNSDSQGKNYFRYIKEELKKEFEVTDLEEFFDQSLSILESESTRLMKEISDAKFSINTSGFKNYKDLIGFVNDLKQARWSLLNKTKSPISILYLQYLNGIINKYLLYDYIIFHIVKKNYGESYRKTYDDLISDLNYTVEIYTEADFYTKLIYKLFNIESISRQESFLDVEYGIIDILLKDSSQNLESINLYKDKQQILNDAYKKECDKNDILREENKSFQNSYKKLKDEKTKYFIENKFLKEKNQELELSRQHLYEDYLFGDFLMVYEKLYFLLVEYESIKNYPFSIFTLALQEDKKLDKKLNLETSSYFTTRLIGYLFYKLLQFSVRKNINNENQDILKTLNQRFQIVQNTGEVSEIKNRYFMDIKKETNLTPKQLEIKDRIDDILDDLL